MPRPEFMDNNILTYMVAPVLGWLTVASLVLVAYLVSLEIGERRRNRRLEQKRKEMNLRCPYRPKSPRRLAFQTTVSPSSDTTHCPKFRQAFLKIDRPTGWNRTATSLN
jgi:hypothetical protein